jgi:hypothetical protein
MRRRVTVLSRRRKSGAHQLRTGSQEPLTIVLTALKFSSLTPDLGSQTLALMKLILKKFVPFQAAVMDVLNL